VKVVKKHTGFFLILLLILLAGCRLNHNTSYEEEVDLYLVCDQNAYRPNEPVLATLRVKNLTDKNLEIYHLDARSVSFYKINERTGEPLEVMPVFSEKEPMLTSTEIGPYGEQERMFVFTTITEDTGKYALQAFYEISPDVGDLRRANVISEPRYFTVSGAPDYERDGSGILLEKDAIEIATKRLGRPVRESKAKLVINEAGFYDWWVTLTIDPDKDPEGKPLKKAYFINPYLARIRKEANPFETPPEKEAPPVLFKVKDKME